MAARYEVICATGNDGSTSYYVWDTWDKESSGEMTKAEAIADCRRLNAAE